MSDSRRLVFYENGNEMKEFKTQVTIMTNLKLYIEKLCENREKIDASITSYLKQVGDSDSLVLVDKKLDELYNVNPIFNRIKSHPSLQRLTLSGCHLG